MPQLEIFVRPKKITSGKIIIILFIIILLIAIGLWVLGNYFYDYAIKSTPYEERTANNDNAPIIEDGKITELEMTSRDDLKLIAYEVENEESDHKWVIVVHGYKSSAKDMGKYIDNFYKLGYSVLALDLRGQGASEGNYIGMGFKDRLDVIDWAQGIIDKDKDAEINLFGISMGGATVMMASGEDLPINIKSIVSDCGYALLYDEFSYQLKQQFGFPDFPVLNAADMVTRIKAGYTYEEASALDAVGQSVTPTLFIHGTQDDFVPFDNLQILYDNASCEKDMLVVQGAGHAESEEIAGEEYWNTIKSFMDEHRE